MAAATVFFLSDYGYRDEFAGVVRAVLAARAPGIAVVDLTHGVVPFDVIGGGLALERAVDHLGPGVVLAVVDPGVGGDRRGVAVETAGPSPRWFVGPDNGLLVPAVERAGGIGRAVALAGRSTFDGRDVFAPAAARLATAGSPDDLGPAVEPATLTRPPVRPPAGLDPSGGLVTAVRWIDGFGNVALDAVPGDLDYVGVADHGRAEVVVASRSLAARRVAAFAELDRGQLGLLPDADGHVALVADRASAAARLGDVRAGTPVVVRPADP